MNDRSRVTEPEAIDMSEDGNAPGLDAAPGSELQKILDQPAEPFPDFRSDAHQLAAFNCIVEHCFSGQDPRHSYSNLDWDPDARHIGEVDASTLCAGIDQPAFEAVRTQLNAELTAVADTRTTYQHIMQWYGQLYEEKGVSLLAIGDRMSMTSSRAQASINAASLLEMAVDTGLSVAEKSDEFDPAVKVLWSVAKALINSVDPASGRHSGRLNQLEGELADLEEQLTSWFNSYNEDIAKQLDTILGDWGRLSAFERSVSRDFVWDAQSAAAKLVQTRKAYELAVWPVLAGQVWKLVSAKQAWYGGGNGFAPPVLQTQIGQYTEKWRNPDWLEQNAGGYVAEIVMKNNSSILTDTALVAHTLIHTFDITGEDLFRKNVWKLEHQDLGSNRLPAPVD